MRKRVSAPVCCHSVALGQGSGILTFNNFPRAPHAVGLRTAGGEPSV